MRALVPSNTLATFSFSRNLQLRHALRKPINNLRTPINNQKIVSEHLPSHLMPALYAAADCFVLPTHGEGWGLPTMEAMAMGLPVITTNWGGSTEFVTRDTGYLLDVCD
jgi:glycosyltransferase involved in cell wall biosynthesis